VRIALTRPPTDAIAQCALTFREREPIDVPLAIRQHRAYEAVLEGLGCKLLRLPSAPQLPDAVFVEDTAVVLDEVAVIARPGIASRRDETIAVAEALAPYRAVHAIEAPGTLEGGDVIVWGRTVLVGRSARTNDEGIAQLECIIARAGYQLRPVDLNDCLHLRTAACLVGEHTVLLNPDWVDPRVFQDLDIITVDPAEPWAANAVRVGNTVIHAAGGEHTRRRLEGYGIDVRVVVHTELEKAEAGVTCCSLILNVDTECG
jgi:dimethylargininase